MKNDLNVSAADSVSAEQSSLLSCFQLTGFWIHTLFYRCYVPLILSHSLSAIYFLLLCFLTVISAPSVPASLSFLRCGLQKMDTTARAVMDIITKTTEYLQPNPGDINQLCEMIM